MVFTRDDYTVAWICALPLEMAAAKVMLDEVHPPLPQPETDHNVYTLGKDDIRYSYGITYSLYLSESPVWIDSGY
ncbi:hypothetical protein ANOM_008823 [Aspergillus nomiae NRRL 13137]|uniref:Uncharacterized protein n=1 Tax=Aspergillus nomiae NRRL (strain ATCC 15546 / NRRL 13137 / CBS 260.88 / M93) TaxID=1509407 RepID=A0A0L1IUN8_ASPN3|nr:uncharacterized protein ANOM_008823 [Aspergillus nomiae NRRL 13137]KNG83199.1 hypothetical protein ANOM_008823 [Aspergillus nomiae NRRL 13137]